VAAVRRAIHVWSRKQVEAMGPSPLLPVPVDAVLISITTPGREPFDNRGRWRRVLKLAFDDSTPEGAAASADAWAEHRLFNWEQARLIIDFVEQNLHCDWHVHCDAGKSRSVGVAYYLARRHGRELKIHSVPSDEFRNLHVIRVLREAAGEERATWPT